MRIFGLPGLVSRYGNPSIADGEAGYEGPLEAHFRG